VAIDFLSLWRRVASRRVVLAMRAATTAVDDPSALGGFLLIRTQLARAARFSTQARARENQPVERRTRDACCCSQRGAERRDADTSRDNSSTAV